MRFLEAIVVGLYRPVWVVWCVLFVGGLSLIAFKQIEMHYPFLGDAIRWVTIPLIVLFILRLILNSINKQ